MSNPRTMRLLKLLSDRCGIDLVNTINTVVVRKRSSVRIYTGPIMIDVVRTGRRELTAFIFALMGTPLDGGDGGPPTIAVGRYLLETVTCSISEEEAIEIGPLEPVEEETKVTESRVEQKND